MRIEMREPELVQGDISLTITLSLNSLAELMAVDGVSDNPDEWTGSDIETILTMNHGRIRSIDAVEYLID